jgi:uncharacterized repeat protein (TIGR01451 family)
MPYERGLPTHRRAWFGFLFPVAAAALLFGVAGCVCFPDDCAPAAQANAFTISGDGLVLTKTVPAEGVLGQPVESVITVEAQQDVANAVICDVLPAGATLVKSDPAGQVDGRNVRWTFAEMDKGQKAVLKVSYKTDKEGTLANCAYLSAVPYGCARTVIGKPALTITKTGPAKALVGQDIVYSVVVKNTGSAVATGVKVVDTLPDGLVSASGEKTITTALGDLAPGAVKQIQVPVKAAKRGQFCNNAVAQSANAGEVKAEACTTVTQPMLTVAKSGTKEQFCGKMADYEIVVTNPGDEAVQNVVVTDSAPAGTRIVAAPGATISGGTATWQIPALAGGAKSTLGMTLTSATAGTLCNRVAAQTAEGLTASAEACTLWKGMPAILIEVTDDPDPLLVGEKSTYTIRVTNQGTADDTNVKIVANFAAEIDPASAAGATAGTISGKTVTFAPVAVLGAKQVVTWTVVGKAAAVGDHRLKVVLSSDVLKTPVTEEESTHVY